MIKTIENFSGNFIAPCEVCVVGSGAGGAVIAYELARAGFEVIVVEEGGYHPTSAFSHDPQRMLPKLYRHAGGSFILGNPPILYSEGRCVGGSTVINAGICFRTPAAVLERWESEHDLPDFSPERMAPYFDAVERQLHVQPVPDEVMGNDSLKMELAAKNLSYGYVRVKRNIHACQGTNLCIMGCPTGAKQSTLVAYLPQAQQYGAQIFANCRADKILVRYNRACGVEVSVVNPISKRTRCRGVIKSKAVFVCGGALQTPSLLFRSGLASRRSHVGRNLYVHPNTKVVGIFEEEMKSWQGSIQGFQIDHFAGEGLTFGSTFLPPGILALTLPFSGDQSFERMEYYNHMSVWGVLMEDSHAGRVRHLWNGRTMATYFINQQDRKRLTRGIKILASIFFAAGARAILLPTPHATEMHNEREVDDYLKHEKSRRNINLFTVHLMGTCRIGNESRTSVIDANHEYHGVRNLFIADASVFPTPIRVNPMMTIMALATRAAERFVEDKKNYLN
jgi:choline dehydrogenase-like flavoprotein